jgi:DNA-binding MarR family transcriptional regulator
VPPGDARGAHEQAGARDQLPSGPDPSSRATAEQVADGLHSAAIRLLRWLRREDERSGLSGPRLSALSVIVFGGPVTLGELATAEQVRPPTMTRLVNALEADALVVREPDPTDGRVTRLRATDEGRRLLHEGRARRVAALAHQLAALTPEERTTLGEAAALIERLAARAR